MKILIIHLARLGDILISWPALRALARKFPDAEIHVLTRPRFASALQGLDCIDKIITLPTKEILAPLVSLNMNVPEAYGKLSNFVDQLSNEKYDRIANFSFSPFSSYLTHAITYPQTIVTGYSRFADGFLSIPDDMSAYFYAQVGIGRPNRFHLAEIFASQLELELHQSDWDPPHFQFSKEFHLPEEFVVIHVGASEDAKRISAEKWSEIIHKLGQLHPIHSILIGSKEEKEIARAILAQVQPSSTIDLVGETQLTDLYPLLQRSKCLIGCDSMPIHVASLTKTPTVNISLPTVNFWETGPRAMGSVVVRASSIKELSPESVAIAIRRVLVGERPELAHAQAIPGTPSFWTVMPPDADFDWLMIKALYLSENFPANQSPEFVDGIRKLADVNKFMIEQMEHIKTTGAIDIAAPLIEGGEDVIETIGRVVPSLRTLIRWYQTEKIRIGPDEQKIVLEKTLNVHRLLEKILQLYFDYEVQKASEQYDKNTIK